MINLVNASTVVNGVTLGLCFVGLFMSFRGVRVAQRRNELLLSIFRRNLTELRDCPGDRLQFFDFLRRHREMDDVSFEKMVWRFWVPLDSWYRETDWWVPNGWKPPATLPRPQARANN